MPSEGFLLCLFKLHSSVSLSPEIYWTIGASNSEIYLPSHNSLFRHYCLHLPSKLEQLPPLKVWDETSNIVHMFTVRKRSCGKVMFLQACVKNYVHGGCLPDTPPAQTWQTPPGGQTPPGRQTPPWQAGTPMAGRHPSADGYCRGRCASYWNAFLFTLCKISPVHLGSVRPSNLFFKTDFHFCLFWYLQIEVVDPKSGKSLATLYDVRHFHRSHFPHILFDEKNVNKYIVLIISKIVAIGISSLFVCPLVRTHVFLYFFNVYLLKLVGMN